MAPRSPGGRRKPSKRDAPVYPFVEVDVRDAVATEVAHFFFEHGAAGVEERDLTTLEKSAGAGLVTLVASFGSHAAARAAMKALRASRPILRPRLTEVVGDAWRDAWKEHFAPFSLTPRLIIAPPWSVPPPAEGTRVLVLEPGRAFGTGLHATTSLVASLLDERAAAFAGKTALDVGTGSGILALGALALGAARAVALDTDPDAIDIARENAERNGLSARFDARVGSAHDAGGRFPFVIANIETRILDPLAEDMRAVVAPGGELILSGILAGEAQGLARRYEALGLRLTATRTAGEAAGEAWVALAFVAPP